MTRSLSAAAEVFPIRGSFAISRGARTESVVVAVTLTEDGAIGRGECTPYPRYGESVDSVLEQIEAATAAIEAGAGREELMSLVEPGAARNALDCALWDLEAKRSGRRAWEIAGITMPETLTTAFTLSLDTPEAMAANARANATRPLLKMKLTGEGDVERVTAVREAAPHSTIIVDANEGWRIDMVEPYSERLAALGVAMIEQPLPAADDAALSQVAHPVPLCADESCHDRETLEHLVGRYDVVNIKLDKTGGLTEALAFAEAAEAVGLELMVGCMLATSLSMAPATLVAARARFVDLDGPLLLARDREPGLVYEGSLLRPPAPELWG